MGMTRGEARAVIVRGGPYDVIVILKTNHGDYMELHCTCLISAEDRIRDVCSRLGLVCVQVEVEEHIKENFGAESIPSRIAVARAACERRNGDEGQCVHASVRKLEVARRCARLRARCASVA